MKRFFCFILLILPFDLFAVTYDNCGIASAACASFVAANSASASYMTLICTYYSEARAFYADGYTLEGVFQRHYGGWGCQTFDCASPKTVVDNACVCSSGQSDDGEGGCIAPPPDCPDAGSATGDTDLPGNWTAVTGCVGGCSVVGSAYFPSDGRSAGTYTGASCDMSDPVSGANPPPVFDQTAADTAASAATAATANETAQTDATAAAASAAAAAAAAASAATAAAAAEALAANHASSPLASVYQAAATAARAASDQAQAAAATAATAGQAGTLAGTQAAAAAVQAATAVNASDAGVAAASLAAVQAAAISASQAATAAQAAAQTAQTAQASGTAAAGVAQGALNSGVGTSQTDGTGTKGDGTCDPAVSVCGACDPSTGVCENCDPATQVCGAGGSSGNAQIAWADQEVPEYSYSDVFDAFASGVSSAPVLDAPSFSCSGGGGACPAFSFNIGLGAFSTRLHCDLMDTAFPVINGVLMMLGMIIAVRVVMSA